MPLSPRDAITRDAIAIQTDAHERQEDEDAEATAMFTTIVSQKVIGPSRRLCVSLRGLSE